MDNTKHTRTKYCIATPRIREKDKTHSKLHTSCKGAPPFNHRALQQKSTTNAIHTPDYPPMSDKKCSSQPLRANDKSPYQKKTKRPPEEKKHERFRPNQRVTHKSAPSFVTPWTNDCLHVLALVFRLILKRLSVGGRGDR